MVYSKLTELIKLYVRKEAKGIPTFVRDPRIDGEGIYQGCIRITSCPLCPDAYRDFGGSGQFNPDEIPDVEDAYPIFPGADRDAKYLNDDETVDVCSTYAMTAMKIAKLSRIQEYIPDCLLSGFVDEADVLAVTGEDIGELRAEDGYAKWRGAICCMVEYPPEKPGDKPKPYAMIYVSVSGAKQDEDLRCAMAAVDPIMQFFADEDLDVIAPVLPD